MNPRISSIENTIARDPPRPSAAARRDPTSGGRNVFGLLLTDQLRLAAQSLCLARRVAIVTGFFVPDPGAGETDGPPGAKVVGHALTSLGIPVDYITDRFNAGLLEALGLSPIVDVSEYLDGAEVTHLISIERVGRAADGRYRNMRGRDVTDTTPPLDELFIAAADRGLTTVGIGDGGNEIGMGRVFADILQEVEHGPEIGCIVPTDFCIAAGVSNWGAYGLAGALSILEGRDLLPSAEYAARDIECLVSRAGAVDGLTGDRSPTVDGLPLADSLRMLESIRRQIARSPIEEAGRKEAAITVGVIGYGQTGRAATELLSRRGHRVLVSDEGDVTVEGRTQLAGVETGGHSIDFCASCDLVAASPGVAVDAPIRDELHRRGIPVFSELEMAYQVCDRRLLAVTGTYGKRTTVKLMRHLWQAAGWRLSIGGNRGLPLSALLLDDNKDDPIALAVSSFQLETVVQFRPSIAVVLNLDRAHLDRHHTIAEYVRIKSRVFMNQQADDVLILNFDDAHVRPLARKHHGRTLYVSARQPVDRGAWLDGEALCVNVEGETERFVAPDYPFAENVLAAALAARLRGVPLESIQAGLASV